MKTIKLSVTHRGRLLKKYGQDGYRKIQEAIGSWIEKDGARGITTVNLALDDAEALAPYGIQPLTGIISPNKVKATIDSLFRKLSPDYLVLLGSGDVIPFFQVPNPSFNPINGDRDELVPTDNPYACSRPFNVSKRETYLIPDRVVGRIPDLPGQSDATWLTDYLASAETWKLATAQDYGEDLFVCCDPWKDSGNECVKFLSRNVKRLLISPPNEDTTASLRKRHKTRLHMIKCHGAPLDSKFYGQSGSHFPVALTSASLQKRTVRGTVVGAMCCYGSALFDPDDPAAIEPGTVPIPSRYLKQGAWGFAGSTTTAWVGLSSMLCADWVISSFLRGVLQGASLGRALLEAKQDLVRWIGQQGRSPDLAEEKTLLQFLLLGDPGIHAVPEALPAAIAAASLGTSGVRVASPLGAPEERRARRAFRFDLGEQLRAALPQRVLSDRGTDLMVHEMKPYIERLVHQAGLKNGFDFERPLVHEVHSPVFQPELSPLRTRGMVAATMSRVSGPIVRRDSIEYYWMARREHGPVPDIRMLKVETDPTGAVLRTQMLVSS
jgi:hypothetical protein